MFGRNRDRALREQIYEDLETDLYVSERGYWLTLHLGRIEEYGPMDMADALELLDIEKVKNRKSVAKVIKQYERERRGAGRNADQDEDEKTTVGDPKATGCGCTTAPVVTLLFLAAVFAARI